MTAREPLVVKADFVLGGMTVVVAADDARALWESVTACLDASPTASVTVRRGYVVTQEQP